MKKYYFYGLYAEDEPDKIYYVGVTSKAIAVRFSQHKYSANHENRSMPVHKWMYSKYKKGIEIKFKEIDFCFESEWKEKEVYWISYYRKLNPFLLNLQKGGSGVITNNMRKALGKQRGIDAHKKPIAAYTLEGVLVKEFDSLKAASKYFGFTSSSIFNGLRKSNGIAKGYIWKYLPKKEIIYEHTTNSDYNKRIIVNKYTLNGQLVATYQSLRQVLREEFDGNPQNVSGNFLRRKILDKGRIWHNHYWCTGELIKNDDYNFPVIEENKKGIVRRCKTYKEIAEYYKCSVNIIRYKCIKEQPLSNGNYIRRVKI